MTDLRIFAWNPNGIRSLLKQSTELKRFITEQRPDILFFPETKGTNQKTVLASVNKQLTEIFDSAAPNRNWSFYHSNCEVPGRHGNLVAVAQDRVNLYSIRYGMSLADDVPECEGRIISLEISDNLSTSGTAWIIGMYVPNASVGLVRLQYKVDWFGKLKSYIQEIRATHPEHTILAIGDMNVAPDARDLCNPESNLKTPGYSPTERKAWAEMVESLDMADVWREMHPIVPIKTQRHEGAYSFWSTRSQARLRNAGWRLDLAIIQRSRLAQVSESLICPQYLGSDHCPIGVALKKVI